MTLLSFKLALAFNQNYFVIPARVKTKNSDDKMLYVIKVTENTK
jgi:hypothetical protein